MNYFVLFKFFSYVGHSISIQPVVLTWSSQILPRFYIPLVYYIWWKNPKFQWPKLGFEHFGRFQAAITFEQQKIEVWNFQNHFTGTYRPKKCEILTFYVLLHVPEHGKVDVLSIPNFQKATFGYPLHKN